MAFNGGRSMPWSELERIASGRGGPAKRPGDEDAPRSHKREGYQPPAGLRPRADVEARRGGGLGEFVDVGTGAGPGGPRRDGFAVHDDPTYADPQSQAYQAEAIAAVQDWLTRA